MRVWLVEGFTGEYDDRRDWIVGGFLDKNKAEELV